MFIINTAVAAPLLIVLGVAHLCISQASCSTGRLLTTFLLSGVSGKFLVDLMATLALAGGVSLSQQPHVRRDIDLTGYSRALLQNTSCQPVSEPMLPMQRW